MLPEVGIFAFENYHLCERDSDTNLKVRCVTVNADAS
jgi:hypothetical protein